MTWEAITRENTAATQAYLCAILGLSRSAFNASAFLSQGNSAAFPEATASERKALLGTILDPHGFWPHVASCAGAERRSAEAEIAVAQYRIVEGEEKIEALPELKQTHYDGTIEHASCIVVVTAREDEVATAQAALAEAQAAAERVRTLTAERDAAKQAADRAARDLGEASDAGALLADARTQRGALNSGAVVDSATWAVEDLEAKVEEQRTITEARAEALRRRNNEVITHSAVVAEVEKVAQQGVTDKTKSSEIYAQADHLDINADEETDRCQTCGQLLADPDARRTVLNGLRDEGLAHLLKAQGALANVETLEQRAADLLEVIDAIVIPEVPEGDFAGQLAAARKTEARRIELGVLIQGYGEKAARLDELREVHEVAQSALTAKQADLDALPKMIATPLLPIFEGAKNRLANERAALAEIQQRQARLEQQIETLAQVATETEASRQEVAGKQREIDLLKLAERAFGRDGIPALIVESVIGVIEAETNRLLEAMPMSDGETFRVELRTQRALKTAEHLKETLDIVVYDRDGERAYETYSGGEQARLNICLRIALALLLADRRGAESRLLVVDELEYLDQLGQEQLIDVIQSVSNRFDRTIVVSHHAGIRDAFDNTLRIVKDNGVSRVLSDDDGMMVA